jgi:hypothetical protein
MNIADNKWHDVIMAWTGTTEVNGVKIWLDGKLDAQGTAAQTETIQSTANTAIFNSSPFATFTTFPGDLDEIEIYNTTKSPDDFERAYMWDPSLVAYIPFDNGSLVPAVGDFTLTNTGTVPDVGFWGDVDGARQGAGGANGLMANQRIIPLGRKSIRLKFRVSSTVANARRLIAENQTNLSSYEGLGLHIAAAGQVQFSVVSSSAGNMFSMIGNKNVIDGEWHELLCTWDGTTSVNGVKIWIDGELDAQTTAARAQTATPTSNTAFFNSSPFVSNLGFDGDIDEIEIYDTIKTPDDFPREGAGVHLEWDKNPLARPEQTTLIRRSQTHFPQDIADGEFLIDTTSDNHLHLTTELPQFYSAFGFNPLATPQASSPVYALMSRTYGAKWHKLLSPTALERTYNSIGMTFTPSTNTVTGQSSYDNVYPWSEIKLCNLLNGAVTAYEGEPGFTRTPATGGRCYGGNTGLLLSSH